MALRWFSVSMLGVETALRGMKGETYAGRRFCGMPKCHFSGTKSKVTASDLRDGKPVTARMNFFERTKTRFHLLKNKFEQLKKDRSCFFTQIVGNFSKVTPPDLPQFLECGRLYFTFAGGLSTAMGCRNRAHLWGCRQLLLGWNCRSKKVQTDKLIKRSVLLICVRDVEYIFFTLEPGSCSQRGSSTTWTIIFWKLVRLCLTNKFFFETQYLRFARQSLFFAPTNNPCGGRRRYRIGYFGIRFIPFCSGTPTSLPAIPSGISRKASIAQWASAAALWSFPSLCSCTPPCAG